MSDRALHWIPSGEDGWRWELRRTREPRMVTLGFSPTELEGKVMRHTCDASAWHVDSNTVEIFDSMQQAAEWLLRLVQK